MVKEREIRDQLSAYVMSAITLRQFAEWMYGLSIDEDYDPSAEDLVYEIINRLAERSSALYSERDLHEQLVKIASTFTVQVQRPVSQTRSNSLDLEIPKALVAP